MYGLRFNFEQHDIVVSDSGSFATTEISNQNCALIANSELCRLTKPEVGESLPPKLENRKIRNTSAAISSAIRAVERDGGKRVNIYINKDGDLQYFAEYGND